MTIQDTEVTTIVQSILSADGLITGGRTTYLRTLVQATQEELGKGKGEPAKAQLAALLKTHKRFYAVALAAAQAFVPKSTKGRAIELHRRINFARTSLSAVRGHIRAGSDVCGLNASKVSKGSLLQPPQKKSKTTTKTWKLRAQSQTKLLLTTLIALGKLDKASAADEVQIALSALSVQLIEMGFVVTRNPAIAFKEHRPYMVGGATFLPVNPRAMDGGKEVS